MSHPVSNSSQKASLGLGWRRKQAVLSAVLGDSDPVLRVCQEQPCVSAAPCHISLNICLIDKLLQKVFLHIKEHVR